MDDPEAKAILYCLIDRLREESPAEVIRDADIETRKLSPKERDYIMGVVQSIAVSNPPLEDPGVADLTLVMSAIDVPVRGSSPNNVFDIREANLGNLDADASAALGRIRGNIAALYREQGSPDDVRRELLSLGQQLTDLLPDKLLNLIREPKLTRLHLDIAPRIDFPIELVRVDTEERDIMLCERVEISRWYTESPYFYHESNYTIDKAALIVGKLSNAAKFESEKEAVEPITRGEYILVSSRDELFAKVFRQRDHRLFHYKGHIAKERTKSVRGDETLHVPTLSLANGEVFKLTEIGVQREEKQFFDNSPVIFLNGCDSALATSLIGGDTTFPEKFLSERCTAVVATIWEVSEVPASEFTKVFYATLAEGKRVPSALKTAREAVLACANEFSETDHKRFLQYYLTAYGYVYYGPSDLRVSFKQRS